MARLAILIVIFLVLGLCALLAITIVAALRTPAATAANTDPEVLAVLTSAQRRAGFSIGVAVALVLIIISINAAMPASLGLPIALAPMVAATGDIYYGLWYPIIVALMTAVLGIFFLPETKDRDIHHI